MKVFKYVFLSIVLAGCLLSCEDDKNDDRVIDENYMPLIDPVKFVDSITNSYMPLIPGIKFTYQVVTDEGNEVDEIIVTVDTKTIMGVKCIVVSDISRNTNGDTLESTKDWYAQDLEGNVWYFGEDTKEYENGVISSTEGSWMAGENKAQPGIVMFAKPILGIPYRQEYLFNEAEDMGKVISMSENVTVPYGIFSDCMMTEEWSPLEPDVIEHKYYAYGIGNIKSVMIEGGNEISELTSVSK
jgi:hypothetical protein